MPTFKMFATLNVYTKLNMDTIIYVAMGYFQDSAIW